MIPELQRTKNLAYDALNANPTRYYGSHLHDAGDALEQRFWNADKYIRRDSPSTFTALDDMRAPHRAAVRDPDPNAIATVTPGDIDLIRKGINNIPARALTDYERPYR